MITERKGIRASTRIPLELHVQMRWKSPGGIERKIQAKTGNMSGNGLFIVTPVRLRHDTQIKFTISLPMEITKIPTELLCTGRVVRQYPTGANAGIGVVIDDYRLRHSHQPV
jgi:PilZ domain